MVKYCEDEKTRLKSTLTTSTTALGIFKQLLNMFTHEIAGGKEAQPFRSSYLEILNIYAIMWPDLNKIVLSSRI